MCEEAYRAARRGLVAGRDVVLREAACVLLRARAAAVERGFADPAAEEIARDARELAEAPRRDRVGSMRAARLDRLRA